TWKELEEHFNPNAAFLPRGSVCDGLSVTILFRQFHIRLHRFPGRPPPPIKKVDRHGARFMARKIYGTPLDGSPAARHRRKKWWAASALRPSPTKFTTRSPSGARAPATAAKQPTSRQRSPHPSDCNSQAPQRACS